MDLDLFGVFDSSSSAATTSASNAKARPLEENATKRSRVAPAVLSASAPRPAVGININSSRSSS